MNCTFVCHAWIEFCPQVNGFGKVFSAESVKGTGINELKRKVTKD